MELDFEWDEEKARTNERKHGVCFVEASTVFGDPYAMDRPDPGHSDDEDRFLLLGSTPWNLVLVVVFTERGDNIRIISARPATRGERKSYEDRTG